MSLIDKGESRLKPKSLSIQDEDAGGDDDNSKAGYKRTLEFSHLLMFGIGNTIGAGVFALTGIAAQYAGPSLFVGFMISGTIAMTTGLVYAEFAARMPFSGSGYVYIYTTFGELPAWIIGWNMNLRYGVSSGGLARGWASYLVGLLKMMGIALPGFLYQQELFGLKVSIIAALYIIVCTMFANRGSKESNVFNFVFTIGKLITLFAIILIGFFYFDKRNYSPFFVPEFGFKGTLEAASLTFYAYLGFDFITTIAEEAKNP